MLLPWGVAVRLPQATQLPAHLTGLPTTGLFGVLGCPATMHQVLAQDTLRIRLVAVDVSPCRHISRDSSGILRRRLLLPFWSYARQLRSVWAATMA